MIRGRKMPKQVTKRANPVVSYPRLDLRGLVRPALWGSAAVASLLIVAFASQTAIGKSRLSATYGAISGSGALAASDREQGSAQRERALQAETRHLTETMRNLSEDRDQLLARMAVLERNYEDMTGSIGRLGSPPTLSTTEQLFPMASSTELAPVIPPPQPTAPIATLPADREGAAKPQVEGTETTSARTDFGVDLGGASTLSSMRAAWNQVRRNHAALLDGLRPVIGIRDGKGGQVDLRLIAGPIPNAAAAAKLCAALIAAGGLACQPATFDGQRLALR
jgi:hypothetical protein